MKKNFLFNLFSLLLIVVLFGCSEEVNTDFGSYVDPNSQNLTVTQKNVTASTFTYSVEVKDAEIPYLVMFIDKTVIDDVAKSDLPEYVMKEAQSVASSCGKTLQQYLDSVSVKGNVDEKVIKNLLPGSLYELVVLPFSGTKPANKAETLFFQTLKADAVDCSFDVEVLSSEETTASFGVTPSDKNIEWYTAVLTNESYESAKKLNYSDEFIIQNVFAQQFEYILAQLAEGDINKVTDELVNQALDQLFFKGDNELTYKNLTSNTKYICLFGAYDRVLLSSLTEAVLVSKASTKEFSTKAYEFNDVTFDLEAVVHDGVRADIYVKPSDKNMAYAFWYESFTEENKDYDNMQMAELLVKMYAGYPPFMWANYKGDMVLMDKGVTPGSENFILAFTYNNGITSNPALYKYTVPAAGDPNKLVLTYKDVNATAYNLSMKSEVSDNTILYASIVVPVDSYNETEYKALVEANIAYEYKMNSQYNPSLTMESFLYNNDYYRPGNKTLVFEKMQASTDYIVASMIIDATGKVVRVIEQPVTTKELSAATVIDKIEGVFSGDDAADIFNNESARGRAVVALRYTPGANSKDVIYGVAKDNERITDSKDDYFILAEYNVPWNAVGESGLSFVICDWNNKYFSFSYAKDNNGVEGVMKRTFIDNITTSNVGTKEELQALYDETVTETEAGRAVSSETSEQNSYIRAKVVSAENGVNPYKVKLEKVLPSMNKDLESPVAYIYNGKFSSLKFVN